MCQTSDRVTCIQLPCPKCGEEVANITLSLATMGEDEDAFTCEDCGGSFTPSSVREFLARWTKLLAWIDAAPSME